MSKKAILLVLDSLGVGATTDAANYGDQSANTLKHIINEYPSIMLPNLTKLGLLHLINPEQEGPMPQSYYGKMSESSLGKDTVTGHWEMMGVVTQEMFPTYPSGFPQPLQQTIEKIIGRKIIGNEVASGTEIITRLGQSHVQSGAPILYTSADSVLQLAAHEEIVPLEALYQMCTNLRAHFMLSPHNIGRIIARPFIGDERVGFTRTPNRKDYALPIPTNNLLVDLQAQKVPVYSVGKIADIFPNIAFTASYKTLDNDDGMSQTIGLAHDIKEGLIFTNLVDFDMKFGHRRDPLGYGNALVDFDKRIPELIDALGEEDWLILTADHGCDPTATGSDHTREEVPLLIYSKGFTSSGYFSLRQSFADLGATLADYFQVTYHGQGISLFEQCQ